MFASLSEKNVRIFFAGLAVSNIGTWAQTTAVMRYQSLKILNW